MKTISYFIFFLTILCIGCNEDSVDPTKENGSIKMYMTDEPAAFDSVVIFVSEVQVHRSGSDSTSGWFTINSDLRVFDLMQLRNGATVILGDSDLAPASYNQIRLILADANYVVDGGVRYDLIIPSGLQTGIKLNHPFTIQSNSQYELLLDFNIEKSIHLTGNGIYLLQPVIRIYPLFGSGSISGQVQPIDAAALITTTIGTDTISTYTALNGFFKILALPQATYNISIDAINPFYRDTVINNINVMINKNTDIGTIILKNN